MLGVLHPPDSRRARGDRPPGWCWARAKAAIPRRSSPAPAMPPNDWSSSLPPRAVRAHRWACSAPVTHQRGLLASEPAAVTRSVSLGSATDVNNTDQQGTHMTRTRQSRRSLAVIAVVGVIGACGSAALAGTGYGSSTRAIKAVNREKAIAIADVRVSTPAAPARSLPSGSAHSPSAPAPSTSRTHAGSPSTAPGGSLPRRAVGARSGAGSLSAPSSTGALPSRPDSPVRSTAGAAAGSTSAGPPARALPGQ